MFIMFVSAAACLSLQLQSPTQWPSETWQVEAAATGFRRSRKRGRERERVQRERVQRERVQREEVQRERVQRERLQRERERERWHLLRVMAMSNAMHRFCHT